MVKQTPPGSMKIEERLDEIASLIILAITRLKEKAEVAGYKRLGEYLAVREKEARRGPCD